MARYVVTGASLTTGRDVRIVLEAATPMAAMEQAQELKIAVSGMDIEPAQQATAPAGWPTTVQAQPVTGHVTIEKTSKPIKRAKVWSMVVAIGGVILMCASPTVAPRHVPGQPDEYAMALMGVGILMAIIGVASLVYWNIKGWWNHG